MKHILTSLTLLAALAVLASCKAGKNYPDPDPGWHSSDYSTLLGRLQRVPAKNPEDPPIWLIRFGLGRDAYRGEFALAPDEKMTGYSGGELIKVRGSIKQGFQHPNYAGTWYEVASIRLWDPYKGR